MKSIRLWLAKNWLKLLLIVVIGLGIKLILGAYHSFYQFITESPHLF
jgi:hypothetical protein